MAAAIRAARPAARSSPVSPFAAAALALEPSSVINDRSSRAIDAFGSSSKVAANDRAVSARQPDAPKEASSRSTAARMLAIRTPKFSWGEKTSFWRVIEPVSFLSFGSTPHARLCPRVGWGWPGCLAFVIRALCLPLLAGVEALCVGYRCGTSCLVASHVGGTHVADVPLSDVVVCHL